MDPSELKIKLEKLNKELDFLREEHYILKKYHDTNISGTQFEESEPTQNDNKGGTSKFGKSRDKKRKNALNLTLNLTQKREITQQQIEELRGIIEKTSNEFKKTIEDMLSQIKEAEIEMAETEKEKADFEKEIILNGKSSRTGKIVAERLKKFLELTLKKKDGLIDKLNIQNQALKTAIRKTQNQLHQREEMGETVSKIDFDKFKIESNQMQLKIDRLNNDLMKLKSTTGQVMQVLSTLTNELNDLTSQNESMKKLIEQRKKYSAQLVQEIEKVMKEYKMEKEKNLLLIAKHKEVKVPQILDYVTLKKECDELNVKVKDWERKLQVIQGEKHVLSQKYNLLMKQQLSAANGI